MSTRNLSTLCGMIRIKPFSAWRPPAEVAARVACVPYDVVSRSEARTLAEGNPLSFLHVVRPDIDLPDNVDEHDESVYKQAVSALKSFCSNGTLAHEKAPAVYLYRQSATLLGRTVSQTGVVACCHIDDYTSGLIKKHEKTRKDKEDDRTRVVLDQNANAEPVFFLHKDNADIAALVKQDSSGTPLYDFTAPDGVRHTVWKASNADAYVKAFAPLPCVYVADGHHRTASAARAGAERRAKNPKHTGNEEYNWFMAVLFPAGELTILPYHRVVKDLAGMTPADFLGKLKTIGTVTSNVPADPPTPGSFCVYLGKAAGGWHRVTLPESSIDRRDPIASLDYVLLSDRVLAPMLGIQDLRTDKRIDFVGGIRGPVELEKRVDEGRAAAAFCMHPVTIQQLIAVADADQIMPPKSTWFEPKLRSGLLVHTLD